MTNARMIDDPIAFGGIIKPRKLNWFIRGIQVSRMPYRGYRSRLLYEEIKPRGKRVAAKYRMAMGERWI
jgi:hypothetical protein